jgi:hypothetical protein
LAKVTYGRILKEMKRQSLRNTFFFLLAIGFNLTGLSLIATAQTTEQPPDEKIIQEKKDENLFSFECYVDLYSAYVWRGLVLTETPVWQPNAILGLNLDEYGQLYTEIFANFNTSTRPGHNHCGGLDEIEYIIGYECDISFLKLGIAHTWWTYPSVTDSAYEPSSREINLNAEIDNDYVIPFVEVDIDYARADGIYGLMGLRKEMQIVDQLMVGAEVTLGAGTNPYTDYYFYNNSTSGLVDGNIALYSQFDITDHVYLGAKIVFTALLDNDIQGVYPEYANNPKDNMIWGGITFGVTF